MLATRSFCTLDAGASVRVPALPPLELYKASLRRQVHALGPQSVLDVGCGDGSLLLELAFSGFGPCTGVELFETDVALLRANGLDVVQGQAEALPFDTGSYDLVIFEHVICHVRDAAVALREAARVARRAVLVLDPWYDIGLASQRTARDLHACLAAAGGSTLPWTLRSTAQLAAPFLDHGGFEVDYSQQLVLRDMPARRVEALVEPHLGRPTDGDPIQARLRSILTRAEGGISEEGAILLTAQRR